MLRPEDFFDLEDCPFKDLFKDCEYVWDALKNLKSFIKANLRGNVAEIRREGSFITKDKILHNGKVLTEGFEIDYSGKKPEVKKEGMVLEGASIICAGSSLMDDNIQIGKNTIVEPGALIKGPTIIGDNTEVRQGAYIRGDVLVGNNCVVGHTTEIKSSALLGGSKAGHFAYIGDSILGSVNLGAGTKLANLKLIDSKVVLNIDGKTYETGLRKFGAIMGEGVETGCNSVTTPGTILGRGVLIYPNYTARGFCPAFKINRVKNKSEQVDKKINHD